MSSIDRPSQGVKALENYNDTFHNLMALVEVIILMDRVERKPDVAACEHQRRRPA